MKKDEITGLVEGVYTKGGTTAGRAWKRHAVKIGGIYYVTFSSTDAKIAEHAYNLDLELTIVYEQTPHGRNIKNIQLVED